MSANASGHRPTPLPSRVSPQYQASSIKAIELHCFPVTKDLLRFYGDRKVGPWWDCGNIYSLGFKSTLSVYVSADVCIACSQPANPRYDSTSGRNHYGAVSCYAGESEKETGSGKKYRRY